MNPDTELDLFRAQVNCAAVLENLGRPGGWTSGRARDVPSNTGVTEARC